MCGSLTHDDPDTLRMTTHIRAPRVSAAASMLLLLFEMRHPDCITLLFENPLCVVMFALARNERLTFYRQRTVLRTRSFDTVSPI